jgi:hypothetical protein
MRLLLLTLIAACSYEAPSFGSDPTDGPAPADAPEVDAPPDTTPACADSDNDGVCNEVDACPGSNDNADDDGDGIADGCDDWPCGEAPDAPSNQVTVGNGTWGATLSNVNFGGGKLKVADKNTDVSLAFAFSIHDSSCPGNCIDQIEVGLIAGDRQKCPFDATVQKGQNITGNRTTTIRTPNASGTYFVRYSLGQNFSCTSGGANTWWLGPPGDGTTIAILCVP